MFAIFQFLLIILAFWWDVGRYVPTGKQFERICIKPTFEYSCSKFSLELAVNCVKRRYNKLRQILNQQKHLLNTKKK